MKQSNMRLVKRSNKTQHYLEQLRAQIANSLTNIKFDINITIMGNKKVNIKFTMNPETLVIKMGYIESTSK